ncbi:MAG: hypothetical protein Q9174_004496 [Haloplaca sp. 1 TL-2023]
MQDSTSSHPPRNRLDATTTDGSQKRLSPSATTRATEQSDLEMRLRRSLRQYPDFPSPGILFEDILPIFADAFLHESLIRALELRVDHEFGTGEQKPDVVVGLEARGFLFGPSLALRLGAGFVPVRKPGKLPGGVEKAAFQKEYGEDFFEIQKDGINPGQRVIIVDDIIATGLFLVSGVDFRANANALIGGSAAAAGSLVKKLGGQLLGYIFILELNFLKGRDKLDAPVHTLLSSQEEASTKT